MSKWGPLADRYESKRPRKILSLDGGGIRGVITLEILLELEKQLKAKHGNTENFTLSQYFDFIGGTSTGAIIASGLSLGLSVSKLLEFYDEFGEKMFDKVFLLKRFLHLYRSGPILDQLKKTFGEDTDLHLTNKKLQTLLCIVTMNRTTDSPWPISNIPFSKYNDITRKDCNLNIKLYQLVRASTAAPFYFGPETLEWEPGNPDKTFVFVDGGVTPYNNPAFLLFRMATVPAYKLEWEKGEDKLLIVSVGTGAAPSEGEYDHVGEVALNLPNNMMYAMQVDQDTNCRTVGRCTYGEELDRELGDMVEKQPLSVNTGQAFLYVRYNATLTKPGLEKMGLPDVDPQHVRKMDSVKYIRELHRVGQAAAKQVSTDHFSTFL
jgi:uncharacterized protein